MIHVVHLTYAVSQGGAARVIVNLSNRLDPSRFRVSIVTETPAGGLESWLEPRVGLYRVLARRGKDPTMPFRLGRVLRRLQPDVLHTHAWGALLNGRLVGWGLGIPVTIHMEHGTLEERPLHRRIQRWLWHRVDAVVAVSEELRDRMSRTMRFPVQRIRLIPNAVDTEQFRPGATERDRTRAGLDAGGGTCVLACVGRLHPIKGHGAMIEALAQLPDSVHLWLVGEGELRDELAAAAERLGVARRVRFLGFRQDVVGILCAADVLVQPSVSEGLSLTVLEGMACALPVVATDVGGNRELVSPGETGLLVPARDVRALAEAVRALASDAALRRAMGERGRARVKERFSLARAAADFEALYLECVERARAHRRRRAA